MTDQFQDSDVSRKDIITPYLPAQARKDVEEWRRHNLLAFQRVIPQFETCECKNCGDLGGVFVAFCDGGPFETPRYSKSTILYFEGNGVIRKGWYTVQQTKAYVCPACGNGRASVNFDS